MTLKRKLTRISLLAMLPLLTLKTATAAEQTSIDLYCQTMVSTLIDTIQYVQKKKLPLDSIRPVEKQMIAACLATPAVNPRRISTMSADEIATVSCVGFAEGASVGHDRKESPNVPYAVLASRREFAAKACASNRKQFQDDIFRHGPEYVMSRKY